MIIFKKLTTSQTITNTIEHNITFSKKNDIVLNRNTEKYFYDNHVTNRILPVKLCLWYIFLGNVQKTTIYKKKHLEHL